MDPTILPAACSTIAVLFLTMIVTKIIARKFSFPAPETVSCQPPVASGAFLLGALPTLLTKGLQPILHDLHAELGSVFTISIFSLKKVTFLVGQEVTAHFFQAPHSEICQPDMYKFTVPIFGKGVLLDADFATSTKQIRLARDALKRDELKNHIEPMVREVKDYFAKWGQDGIVDLKHELRQVLMLIAARCLLGKEVREKMFLEVSTLLHDLFENGTHLITLVWPYLPIPAHQRRDEARAKLGKIFHEIVKSRKISGRAEDDVLQKIMDSKCMENGRSMTENEITGILIAMLFAGQHASSSASSWMGACLLSHEQYLVAAIEEQKKLIGLHGEHMDENILMEMVNLQCCIKEAIRMHSPSAMIIRHAKKNFTVQTREDCNYEIPKGQTVATSVAVGNRLPHIYKDPHIYDPHRFGPGREEDKVGGKFAYPSFGGGRHACPGGYYAFIQIKVIWSFLLRNFELKMVSPFPQEEFDKFTPGPKGKVMVSYKKRLLLAST